MRKYFLRRRWKTFGLSPSPFPSSGNQRFRREEGETTRSTTKGNYSFDRTIAIHGARSRQGLIINSNLGVRAICDSAPLSTGSKEGRVAGLSLNLARPRVVASLNPVRGKRDQFDGKRERPYQFLIASRFYEGEELDILRGSK